MNKSLRYLIFVLLFAGVGYAVYSFMNKPASNGDVTATATEPENTTDQKVADGEQMTTEGETQQVAQDQMPASTGGEATEVAEDLNQEPVAQENEEKPTE
jgi:hypothetical protein